MSRGRTVSMEQVAAPSPTIEITPSREAQVGGTAVRRALPQRTRRTVGAWCFADHLGPVSAAAGRDPGIGPHPHCGLHTVTWLLAGELVHRDSVGSVQSIRPGQLNLMTAGHGVSHAEEGTGDRGGSLHGIQLWVAQPETTRHGPPAFEHHPVLPTLDLDHGHATVLAGELGGAVSPARRDTPLVGVELALRPGATHLPLVPTFEYALVVLEGAVDVGGRMVTPGHLGYLAAGGDELSLAATGPTTVMLLGGAPFESPVVMWWNFVGRDRQELVEAGDQWNAGAERFGETGSSLDRIPAPPPPWGRIPVAQG